MQSFAVITDTPARLATFLEARGIIEKDAQGNYVGVRPGMEWIEIPNPIVTDNSDPDNPVHDTRHVYLVKFAHESEGEKAQGFKDWLQANTTVQAAPPNYTINGEPVGNARKVNGEQVWLAHESPERFGGWQ